MNFKIKADAVFEAKNINDAFRIIGRYFLKVAKNTDTKSPFFAGKIEIRKQEVKTVFNEADSILALLPMPEVLGEARKLKM
jgi:hypothetical protein